MSTQTTAAPRATSAGPPPEVLDHAATPEWDTSQHSDFCDTCGWPVSREPDGVWTHDKKNPVHWTDRRRTTNNPAAIIPATPAGHTQGPDSGEAR